MAQPVKNQSLRDAVVVVAVVAVVLVVVVLVFVLAVDHRCQKRLVATGSKDTFYRQPEAGFDRLTRPRTNPNTLWR